MSKSIISIPVMPGTKLVRVEWVPPLKMFNDDGEPFNAEEGHWRLWTHHDLSVTNGTFIRLDMNGGMTRVVVHPDGHEDYFIIKDAE